MSGESEVVQAERERPVGEPRYKVCVDDVPAELWNHWLDQFSDANLYQTRAYGTISWGGRQLSHLVLEHDDEPVAMAQLRVVRLPLLRRGVAYLRWGPVCARRGSEWDADIERSMMQALIEEYVVQRRLLLRVIPAVYGAGQRGQSLLATLQSSGLHRDAEAPSYRTLRVDLQDDLNQVRKRLAQKWRNQLNAGQRNTLHLRESVDDALFAIFLRLYEQMMGRKQFDTTVSVPAFRCMQEHLPDSQKMQILIAERDGEPVAGLVGSAMGDTGIYLLGATTADGMKCKAAYVLQWRMMEWLKERGCAWYDLGGINPETNPGVYHFKSGMGGQEVRFPGRFSASGGWLSQASVACAEWGASVIRWQRTKAGAGYGVAEGAGGPRQSP